MIAMENLWFEDKKIMLWVDFYVSFVYPKNKKDIQQEFNNKI